jgi:uncharacterized protein
MEQPYATENSTEGATTPERPPALEFAMGVALFSAILLVFMLVQFVVLMAGVARLEPAYSSEGFSLGLLQDPMFRAAMDKYLFNGDLVAHTALWSGLIGVLLIAATTYLWKRAQWVEFLGLRMASLKQFLLWTAVFLALAGVLELLMRMSPSFQTDFMEKVLASNTDRFLLILGVGIMAPLFEEFLLRGLLLGSIRHVTDGHTAVALTAGVFTLMHLQYSWTVMLLILPMGVVLGYARVRSGSLWVPVLLHVLNNMATVVLG